MKPPAEQLRVLTDGAEQVLPAEEFERKVTLAATGKRAPLRAKLGVDPTSPDLHLGHTVVLGKLRQFQDLGHTAVLIVGGFTAQVGDPSGRTAARPRLTADDVAANARTYLAQVRKVLRDDRLEIVDNADWLSSMDMADVLGLTSLMTVARMLERADFAARYKDGKPIAVSEFLYPLLQGQDSVEIRADVELGGTDQIFNLLVGRDLQTAAGQEPQCVLTMPLIEGLDGSAKMSKSADNTIGVNEDAPEMFAKAMSLRDELMPKYYRLVSGLALDTVTTILGQLSDGSLHPGDAKRQLGRAIVTRFHSEEAATAAEARFDAVFRRHQVPDDVAEHALHPGDRFPLPALLADAGLAASRSEARRKIIEGAVRLDGTPLADPGQELTREELAGKVLQLGKRRFVRLTDS